MKKGLAITGMILGVIAAVTGLTAVIFSSFALPSNKN